MASSLNVKSTADDAAEVFAEKIKGSGVIVTGVSLGSLGFETALSIAKKAPALLVLTGRSLKKIQETEAEIKKLVSDANIRLLVMDLSSLASVKTAAEEVNAYPEPINVLINSAGIMAAPYTTTSDGFESQFGTNHLGPFLFTQTILLKLLASPGAGVVVNVSSLGCNGSDIRYEDPGFDGGKAYQNWLGYGQAKTANALYAVALSNKYSPKLRAYALQPGMVYTPLFKHIVGEEKKIFVDMGCLDEEGNKLDGGFMPWKSPQEGGATSLVAAFNDELPSGSYLMDCQVIPDGILLPYVLDPKNADKLWDLSVELIKSKGFEVK